MAEKVKYKLADDPRYESGTIASIEVPKGKENDEEYIDRALNDYVNSRYGPKQPVKSVQEINQPAMNAGVEKMQYEKEPALSRLGQGLIKGVTGLEGTMPGHAQPAEYGAKPGEPYWQGVKHSLMGRDFNDYHDLPVVSNVENMLSGDVAGEVGQVLPAAAAGTLISPKIRAVGSGFGKGFVQASPSISRWSAGGMLGMLWDKLHGGTGYSGAAGGALAEQGLERTIGGIQQGIQNAKAAPWLSSPEGGIHPITGTQPPLRPVTTGGQPQDIHPVTKAEGQSAYSRPRLPAPNDFGPPQRTNGAIPQGPIEIGRPYYPEGTAPEQGNPANVQVMPWRNPLQLPAGNESAFQMPPAGSSNITTLPSQRALPAPGNEPIRTQGAIPVGPAKVHEFPASTRPVERGPVRAPLQGGEPITPKTEEVTSNRPSAEDVGKKLVGNVRQEAMASEAKGVEQPQPPEKLPEPKKAEIVEIKKKTPAEEMIDKVHEKNTITSSETEVEPETKKSFTLGDIHNLAERLGVTQSSVARWMIEQGHTVERSKFGGWGEKIGKKKLNNVIDKIGTDKFNQLLKDIKEEE